MAFQISRESYFLFLAGSTLLLYISTLFPLNQSDTSFLKFGHFKERNYSTDTETSLEKDFSHF